MAGTLPSPTGGMNPWGAIVQPQQPRGPNPIMQALFDERGQRLQREGNAQTAALQQLGSVGIHAGGIPVLQLLNQTMRANGLPNFETDPRFAQGNDMARVREKNATAMQAGATAMNQAAPAGSGVNFRSDMSGTFEPLNQQALDAIIARAAAGAPKTYNVDSSAVDEASTTTEGFVPSYDAAGNITGYNRKTTKTGQRRGGQAEGSNAGQTSQGAIDAMPPMPPTTPTQGQQQQLSPQAQQLQQKVELLLNVAPGSGTLVPDKMGSDLFYVIMRGGQPQSFSVRQLLQASQGGAGAGAGGANAGQ